MAEQAEPTITGGQPEPKPAATTPTTQQQPDPAAELAQVKKDLETEKARSKEHEEAATYWHQQARGGSARDGAEKPAKDEEPEDNTDLLEVATKGPKAMKQWLKDNGFVSQAEVEQTVQEKASQLAREAQVVREYPELADHSSDFFKETAQEYGRLKSQGVPEGVAMELAAERVAVKRGKGGDGGEGGGKKKAPAGESAEDRTARAKAQAGEGTKTRPAQQAAEDEELTPEQKRITEAFGITEDAYKKRAKEGVRFAR